jgi:predicted transcriptional regulator
MDCMPKRLRLSPLQRDIMLTLEEAGAETVGTVVATLKITDQDSFNAQVNGLVTLGLVRKDESNLVLTEMGKVTLRT